LLLTLWVNNPRLKDTASGLHQTRGGNLIVQRVVGIALGYEDLNGHDNLAG
jgi:hypothetical protein